jgi:hypothetical protein
MKFLNILLFALLFLFYSCGQQFKEIAPLSNENNIKLKLEVLTDKQGGDLPDAFTLRISNTGERDIARCTLKFDNKYEHQLEGLINKDSDWEGKLKYSLVQANESVTIVFSKDIDNYSIFGITDKNFKIPETIALNSLDGKIVWKITQ